MTSLLGLLPINAVFFHAKRRNRADNQIMIKHQPTCKAIFVAKQPAAEPSSNQILQLMSSKFDEMQNSLQLQYQQDTPP